MRKGQKRIPINKRGSKVKLCTKCLVKLTNKNWHKYAKQQGEYTCDTCRKRYDAKYNAEHYLDTCRDGKTIFLKGNKRPRPIDGKCELCHLERKFLAYHHWDDKDISKGIWCCHFCHGVAETIDRIHNKIFDIIRQYLNVKGET